jgi:hypothetical protein
MAMNLRLLTVSVTLWLGYIISTPARSDTLPNSNPASQEEKLSNLSPHISARRLLVSQATPRTFYSDNRSGAYSLTITKVSGTGRFRTVHRIRVEANKRDSQVIEVDCRTLNSRFRVLNGKDISGPMFDDMWLPDPTGSNRYACSL